MKYMPKSKHAKEHAFVKSHVVAVVLCPTNSYLKVIEMGPRFNLSSERLEKSGINESIRKCCNNITLLYLSVLDVQSSFVDSSLKEFTVKNVVRTQTNLNQVPSNESFICTENLSDSFESSQTIEYCCTDGETDFSERSMANSFLPEASQSFNSSQKDELQDSFESNLTINYSQNNSENGSEEQNSPESTSNDAFVDIMVNKCKCIYTNADQLQNKLDELRVQSLTLDADYIFVTEVLPKFNPDNISCASMIYHIDDYNAFHSTDNGRGVIIYAKDTFNISPNQYLNSLYHDATWCDWTVDQKTIILGCIYRSPSDVQSCETILHFRNK